MGYDTRRPFPWDVMLNQSGFMLARTKAGNPAWREDDPPQLPPGEGQGEQTVTWDDLSGGVGVPLDLGTPESRRSLWASLPPTPAGQYGGVDASWGMLMLGPKVNTRAVGTATTVHKLVYAMGYYWAAIGPNIYRSSDPTFAPASTILSITLGSDVLDLAEFQGTVGWAPMLYACQQFGPIRIFDGAAWQVDGGASGRSAVPQAWYRTATGYASGAVGLFTDDTAAVSDANPATGSNLSGLPPLSAADGGKGWVIVGLDRPFTALTLTMDPANLNTTACACRVDFWTGTSWVQMVVTDGTAVAGASLGKSGVISWARPLFDWPRSAVTDIPALVGGAETAAYQFVRLSWTAALDASTVVAEAVCSYTQEAQAACVVGPVLWFARDRNLLYWTEDGGITPTYNEGLSPVGSYAQVLEGLEQANGAVFLKREHQLAAPQKDGSISDYLPELWRLDWTWKKPLASWLGKLYVGHGSGLYEIDPQTGNATDVGPSRLQGQQGEPARILTCVTGDRAHFLYGARWDGSKASLMKLGGYHQVTTKDGVIEWSRFDSWHEPTTLPSGPITAMTTWMATDQPLLVMGDTGGNILWVKLPRGAWPLEANSGYEFAANGGALLPRFRGDATRPVVPLAWTLLAQNLSAGHQSIQVQTRDVSGGAPTTFFAQGPTATVNGGEREAATVSQAPHGLDVALWLASDDVTKSPTVTSFSLHYKQPWQNLARVYTLVVQVGQDVVNRLGQRAVIGTREWKTRIAAIKATTVPLELVKPDGSLDYVLPERGMLNLSLAKRTFGPEETDTLTLSSAR